MAGYVVFSFPQATSRCWLVIGSLIKSGHSQRRSLHGRTSGGGDRAAISRKFILHIFYFLFLFGRGEGGLFAIP